MLNAEEKMFNEIVAETVVAYHSIFSTLLPNQHLAGHIVVHKKILHVPYFPAVWDGHVTEFRAMIFKKRVIWNF